MGLTCDAGDYDGDGFAWYWEMPADYTPLATPRRKRCRSCHTLIDKGHEVSLDQVRAVSSPGRCEYVSRERLEHTRKAAALRPRRK